jgi:hypothetical protein
MRGVDSKKQDLYLFVVSEKTHITLNMDPREHPAQHDRRRLVHGRSTQRKAQADPCAEGLAGKPVSISEIIDLRDLR